MAPHPQRKTAQKKLLQTFGKWHSLDWINICKNVCKYFKRVSKNNVVRATWFHPAIHERRWSDPVDPKIGVKSDLTNFGAKVKSMICLIHGSAAAKTVKKWTLVYKDDAKGIISVETRQVIAARQQCDQIFLIVCPLY